MMESKHLNENRICEVITKVEQIEQSLHGLVCLLTSMKGIEVTGKDMHGVGRLIEGQVEELAEIKYLLQEGDNGEDDQICP